MKRLIFLIPLAIFIYETAFGQGVAVRTTYDYEYKVFDDSLVGKRDTVVVSLPNLFTKRGIITVQMILDSVRRNAGTDTTLSYTQGVKPKVRAKYGSYTPFFSRDIFSTHNSVTPDSAIWNADSSKYKMTAYDSLPLPLGKIGEFRIYDVGMTGETFRLFFETDTLRSDTTKAFIRGRVIAQ